VTGAIRDILAKEKIPSNVRVNLRGWSRAWRHHLRALRSVPDFFSSAVPHPDSSIQIFHRSFPDHAGNSYGVVGVLIILPLTTAH